MSKNRIIKIPRIEYLCDTCKWKTFDKPEAKKHSKMRVTQVPIGLVTATRSGYDPFTHEISMPRYYVIISELGVSKQNHGRVYEQYGPIGHDTDEPSFHAIDSLGILTGTIRDGTFLDQEKFEKVKKLYSEIELMRDPKIKDIGKSLVLHPWYQTSEYQCNLLGLEELIRTTPEFKKTAHIVRNTREVYYRGWRRK